MEKCSKPIFTYEEEVDSWDLERDNVMGIDLGVNNFATFVTSEGSPYVVDGRLLKNQIYFKCKNVSKLQSILNKQGLKKSKRIENINEGFKGIQNNYLNHTIKFILETCKEQNVGTIILGYHYKFQYKSNMGKKTKPNIFSLCIQTIQRKTLKPKCKLHDIILIIQEESFASKSSFLDNDILPVYQANKKKGIKYEFKGKRIKRGLYKTLEGKLINADVNAAANIIRKSKQKFNFERLCKWVMTAPTKIRPLIYYQ